MRRITPVDIQKLRFDPVDPQTQAKVDVMLGEIKSKGRSAILKYAVDLQDVKPGEPFYLKRDELKKSYDSVSFEEQQLLQRVAAQIKAFAGQ